jgi:hypothetical protein
MQEFDDSLRAEYSRSDFGEMVQGKHATTQLDFAGFVRLLLVCIGEDEELKFVHHSPSNDLAAQKAGDWTYEIDNANQITLRYWLNEFGSIEEPISNPPCVTTPQERADLHNLTLKHVRTLKAMVKTSSNRAEPR